MLALNPSKVDQCSKRRLLLIAARKSSQNEVFVSRTCSWHFHRYQVLDIWFWIGDKSGIDHIGLLRWGKSAKWVWASITLKQMIYCFFHRVMWALCCKGREKPPITSGTRPFFSWTTQSIEEEQRKLQTILLHDAVNSHIFREPKDYFPDCRIALMGHLP